VESILAKGATKSSVILKSGIQCDLRVVTSREYPFALAYFTGSKEHNVRVRSRALTRGWSFEWNTGFSEAEGRELKEPLPEVLEENDIYRSLGLDPVVPELREDRGEIEAAEAHELPDSIEWQNLRGTFHNHTTESDGAPASMKWSPPHANSVEYLGIADHSKALNGPRTHEKRLAAQVALIRELSDDSLRLFAGTECDILKDGTLDFQDDGLASLDYVVVSIHSSFTLPEADDRADHSSDQQSLRHHAGPPHLATPADPRTLPRRCPGRYQAAAETGTIIESNANPRRLDMDWRWWPLAKRKASSARSIPCPYHRRAPRSDLRTSPPEKPAY